MEVETEVTITDLVLCPHCGQWFDAEVTGEVTIEVEPDDMRYDLD